MKNPWQTTGSSYGEEVYFTGGVHTPPSNQQAEFHADFSAALTLPLVHSVTYTGASAFSKNRQGRRAGVYSFRDGKWGEVVNFLPSLFSNKKNPIILSGRY